MHFHRRTAACLVTAVVGSAVFAAPPPVRAASALAPSSGTGKTVAGSAGSGRALDVNLHPGQLALADDAVYVTDSTYGVVRRFDRATGELTVVAGAGGRHGSADGPAGTVQFRTPLGLARVGATLYVSDYSDDRLRRVADAMVTTVAGRSNESGGEGDGGPSTAARLFFPSAVAADPAGNLFVADSANNRIRRIDAVTGTITTVAGSGTAGFSGDGGPATSATLSKPEGVAVLSDGGLAIADTYNHRIRRVAPHGTITTIAGTGVAGFEGDGTAAVDAAFNYPESVSAGPNGSVLVADSRNHRIRRIASDGTVRTVAGDGVYGYYGDGGQARSAALAYPHHAVDDADGSVWVSDSQNSVVRRISAGGVISTVVGRGWYGGGGDGGPATAAQFVFPIDVAVGPAASLLVADSHNHRIRRITAAGTITTLAGTGNQWDPLGDGGPATAAGLRTPFGVGADAEGNVYISDNADNRIRRVDASDGTITTLAGTGARAYLGDGGPSTASALAGPWGIAVSPAGDVFVADSGNHRVRRIDATDGTIHTYAGTGVDGFAGDGGPATSARLNFPTHLALASDGTLFVVDAANGRVRRIAPDGTITTFAGTGGPHGFPDYHDGEQATEVPVLAYGIDVAPDGDVYVTDSQHTRVRRIDGDTGRIYTVAGGRTGFAGDGQAPLEMAFTTPEGIAVAAVDGRPVLYVADWGNHRIRAVDLETPPPPPPPSPSPSPSPSSPPPSPSLPPPSPLSPRAGYWMVDGGGAVYAFGDSAWKGNAPTGGVVDLEPTPKGGGYWVVDRAGQVFAFGDAAWLGNAPPLRRGEAVSSLSRVPDGSGYWLFTTMGRVFAFGRARHMGDMGAVRLNGPVLDSVVSPDGDGYYMVAADGGIFAFGSARFAGSMGGHRLNAPVQSLVPDGDGSGYWLVASDGGVFAFDASFRGSMGGQPLNRPVTGMVPYGNGYLLVAEDGGVFNFGDRPFLGSLGSNPPAQPVVSVAALDG